MEGAARLGFKLTQRTSSYLTINFQGEVGICYSAGAEPDCSLAENQHRGPGCSRLCTLSVMMSWAGANHLTI